ncbi:MAG: TraR/DksA C4-type zinc finger protein [Candidatus Margulisiibacteriota bacterium]
MYSEAFLAEIKNKLEQEQVEQEAEIDRLTRPEEMVDNPSPEDLANDATEDITEESLLKIYRKSLERVNDALGRMGNGTFGRCIECGAIIKEENLKEEPWIEYCEKCAYKK